MKLSTRSLMRQKGYTFLNIASLGVGMALFLLIAAFVTQELQTDRFHKYFNRLYRLETRDHALTTTLAADFLETALPEALGICRISNGVQSVLAGTGREQTRIEHLIYSDSTFFSIFSFELLQGDPATALTRPMSIVLSQTEAHKLFGDKHPIGQTIEIDNRNTFEVTGVMADFPLNSSIKATAIISIQALKKVWGNPNMLRNWSTWNFSTFVLLPAQHRLDAINQKLKGEMDRLAMETLKLSQVDFGFFLRPMADIYFNRNITMDPLEKGNKTFVMIYIAIGIFILAIAIFNFINLSTALAFRRSREVGLKKVLGSSRGMLLREYLTESALLGLVALVLALVLFEVLLPWFNQVTDSAFEFSIRSHPWYLLLSVIFALFTGLLAGIYPAVYMSRFQPAIVLRGEITKGKRGANLRKTLILFQFTISIVFILATIIILSQMKYARNKDLGFNKENVIYFRRSGEIPRNHEAFKNELKEIPGVKFVGLSSHVPGYGNMGWERRLDTVERRIAAFMMDPEFLDVYGLKISRGRSFDTKMGTDKNNAFLLNETAVREFGLENPVGLRFWDGTVVGVIEDFSYLSVHHEVGPLVLAWMPDNCSQVSVKLSGQNIQQTIQQIEAVWKRFAPNFPFSYSFIDEAQWRLYEKEQRLSKLFLFFSFVAIFVACMGLSGLALFSTQQRTREVGIRKVYGASVKGILLLLTGDFLRWVLMANLLAWPITFYFMNRWLENFAFRISIQWWMFAAAAVIALLIALATISFQAFRTARANPVDSLKYE